MHGQDILTPAELTPAELEAALSLLDRVLRGDQGAAQRVRALCNVQRVVDLCTVQQERLEDQANTLKQRDLFVQQQRDRTDALDARVADLTAKLVEVEQERDTAKVLVYQLSHDTRSPVQDHLLFSSLTQQLASAQAEVARLRAAQAEVERDRGRALQECTRPRPLE